jgi:non-ribosomal peptide synthetase component F
VRGSSQPCDLVIGARTHRGGALGLTVRCRDDLFSATTAARLVARLGTLLLAAVEAPDTRLSELPMMADDERTTVVETWNRTAAPLPDATVHGLVEARIRERPDAPAVVQGERALGFGELGDRADRLAARLRARVAAGAQVGVLVRPSPELAIAALGVLKAGAVYVPLDPGQPAARLAVLAREVELVISEPALADRLAIPQLALEEAEDGEAAPAQAQVSPNAPEGRRHQPSRADQPDRMVRARPAVATRRGGVCPQLAGVRRLAVGAVRSAQRRRAAGDRVG